MTTSISRLTAAGFVALVISLAACGNPDPGVQAGRSDRSLDAEPVTTDPTGNDAVTTTAPSATEPSATASPTTSEPAVTNPADTTPIAERPPAPPASGPGSVSADDLASVFLPANPDLLSASSRLTDGRAAQTFLDEEMTFTGMDPVIEIAGAPITLASWVVTQPTFAGGGATTGAARLRTRYRMAVAVENDDINAFAIALRDELRPVLEAANPGEVVTDTLGEAALGNPIHGLRVGSEEDPTTLIEIDQHYVIVPRLVNDLLLAVNVSRVVEGNDIVPSELPGRDRFVNDGLQAQIDLFDSVSFPISGPAVRTHRVLRNIPSAGAASINRFVDYEVALPLDGFEAFVDSFAGVVEADEYEGVENVGNERSFEHGEQRVESKFVVERDGDEAVVVRIQGDVTAYPG